MENAKTRIPDEVERNGTVKAIENIRSKLGSEFLQRALEFNIDFMFNFTFTAHWHSSAVIQLSNQLRVLENEESFETVLSTFKKLPQKERFHETLTLLDTGCLFKNGFKINFDPIVQGFPKKPDLGLRNETFKEEIFVEISELRDSKEKDDINAMMLLFSPYFHDFRFQTFGAVSRLVPLQEIKLALEEINSTIIPEIGNKGIFLFKKDDWLDLVFYSPEFRAEAEEVAKERGIQVNGFSGPFLEKSEWRRLWNKIFREQEQLPEGRLNILVIWANDLIFDANYSAGPIKDFSEITLRKYLHLSGIIILGVFPNESFELQTSSEVRVLKRNNGLVYYAYHKFAPGYSELERQIMKSVDRELTGISKDT